jgi:hypothetical protein
MGNEHYSSMLGWEVPLELQAVLVAEIEGGGGSGVELRAADEPTLQAAAVSIERWLGSVDEARRGAMRGQSNAVWTLPDNSYYYGRTPLRPIEQ